VPAGRQRRRAIEDADVVEAQESALEHVLAKPVLAVNPPCEVGDELRERPLQEFDVTPTVERLFVAVQEDGRPGVYRGVHV
jgi:hypothetical protein